MMGTRAKLVDAFENDALTRRGAQVNRFRPGDRQRAKRKFWKRQRSSAKTDIRSSRPVNG
jgi:hypothetical protein